MELKLVDMAHDRSPEARGLLLLAVTDKIIEKIDSRSDGEMQAYCDIALILYDTTSTADLQQLAAKVAPYSRMPVALAKRLAQDQIRIASPVLSQFSGFSESDLLELASKLGDAHLQVLAGRSDLTINVTDVIVIRGSDRTHLKLAGNTRVQLSAKSFLNLIHLARHDAKFLDALLLRPDLTPSLCQQLLPNVEADVQAQLRKLVKSSLTSEQQGKLARLKEVRKTLGPGVDESDVSKLWSKCQIARVKKDEIIGVLLQDDRLEQVAALLGKLTQTNHQATRSLIFNGPADKAASLAHNAEMGADTFAMLVDVRCRKMRLPLSKAEEWIKAFEAEGSRRMSQSDNEATSATGSSGFAAKRGKKRAPKKRVARVRQYSSFENPLG